MLEQLKKYRVIGTFLVLLMHISSVYGGFLNLLAFLGVITTLVISHFGLSETVIQLQLFVVSLFLLLIIASRRIFFYKETTFFY